MTTLAAVIAKERRAARCPAGLDHTAVPVGGVGLDMKAVCPKCGRRIGVTARGLYARHNKLPPDGRER